MSLTIEIAAYTER